MPATYGNSPSIKIGRKMERYRICLAVSGICCVVYLLLLRHCYVMKYSGAALPFIQRQQPTNNYARESTVPHWHTEEPQARTLGRGVQLQREMDDRDLMAHPSLTSISNGTEGSKQILGGRGSAGNDRVATTAGGFLTKVELFPHWTTSDPNNQQPVRRVYLYSAIIAILHAPQNGTHVHLTSFQELPRIIPLTCCLKLPGHSHPYQGPNNTVDYTRQRLSPSSLNLDPFGIVYSCSFPFSASQLHAGLVTLTAATACPLEDSEYLPVLQPDRKPGGLAVCAKVAYGEALNPHKLVEWVEAQRLLGVDRIQLFECNNNEEVYRVLNHYKQIGLIDLLPYKLPGRPWGRGFLLEGKDWARFSDETVLPLWECRLRLAGYDYVMDIDLDEIIMPRESTELKPFFKSMFEQKPLAAALFFQPQFFITDWGPVDPDAPLWVLQYLNSTEPTTRVCKYVYKPDRIRQVVTHTVYPLPGYTNPWVSPSVAIILHYRKCKSVWAVNCTTLPRITDLSILRLKEQLVPAVSDTLQRVGLLR